MFDIGFWEIMLISILAMVVIGPERLPGVARTAGHWFGKARRFVEGVKSDVASEFDTTELKRLLHNQEVQLKELQSKVNREAGDIRSGFSYNMDDDAATDKNAAEDDYLEFMDEDEEKDHEQIAAEKKQQQQLKEEEHRKATAQVQKERREARAFENPAVANNKKLTNDDNVVVTDTDKQSRHDG
ncbi:MAG: Sec-independent protein translocase protein TatB [Gammaproteobacteria bacterium]|nr:Sec-independent protein translocase protein TatB [Gammaproteobacteria bacterium]